MGLGNTPRRVTVISLEARKSFAFGLHFMRSADDVALDLTGATVRLTLAQPAYKGGAVLLTKTAVAVDLLAGLVRFELQASELTMAEDEYPFDVTLVTANGYSAPVMKGVVDVRANTDTATTNVYTGINPGTNLEVLVEGSDVVEVKVDKVDGLYVVVSTMISDFRVEMDGKVAQAATSATTASNHATAAAAARDSATTSATSATASKDSAAASASTATTKATEASTSASQAATSATSAAASRDAAGGSELNAAASASQAAGSASSAAASATSASTSATNADASKTAAAASASSADASKTAAATSEASALASKNAAATSETNAAGSASTATTKATEASTSATNAAGSATTATTKATEASTSATNAAASASAAATSETNAAASATSASGSASTATTEANRAKTEADRAQQIASGNLDTNVRVLLDDTTPSQTRQGVVNIIGVTNPAAHTHAQADISGLAASLAGKSDTGHTHTKANITDFAHSHAIGDLPVAPSGTSSATQVVRADDSRLSNTRTPSNDADIVHKAGAETITGAKTFSALLTASAGGYFGSDTSVLGPIINGATTSLYSRAPAERALVIRGQSAQSAVLTEWQNSAGATLAQVDAAGVISSGGQALVKTNDARLSDARTPTAHTHPASDLTATGTRDATTFLRGDNTWSPIDLSTKLDKAGGTITGDLAVNGKTTLGDANTDVVRRKAIEVETDTRNTTLTYTSGKLTSVVEKDGTTTVKTTTLTYTGDNLTQVQEVVDGLTITTTMTYTGSDLTSTTKTVV